jgi:hypothetical protein
MVKASVRNMPRLPVISIAVIPVLRFQEHGERGRSRPINLFIRATSVHAFERSDVRTDRLSETEFNGAGGLQAHISFNRICILHAAMRFVIRGPDRETEP